MAKRLPLSDFHLSNGAVFAERDGWLLPARFGNSAAEYDAVRSTAGLIDLSHRGLLQLSGPDRLSFLQGMVSNDLRAINAYEGLYATVLNQQGKVLGDTRILCSENSFYLDLWEVIKDKIAAHLSRYVVADDVEIADRTEGYATLSIQGPRSEALLEKLLGQAELPRRLMNHAMVGVEGTKVCVVRASHTGETGFDLIIPKSNLANVAQRLTDLGKQLSAAWVGEEAHDTLRIEAGIPRYGVDFTEDHLLLEVGIEHAVSFTKGCYLGQEIVERIRSRGHVNRKLVGLLLEGNDQARPGDSISAGGRETGAITSSVISPTLGRPIALGYVHKDFWTPGTSLVVNHGGDSIPAVIAELPFIPAKFEPATQS